MSRDTIRDEQVTRVPIDPQACRRLTAAVIIRQAEQYLGVRYSVNQRLGGRAKPRKYRVSRKQRNGARLFLLSRDLDFWCQAAGIDPKKVRNRAVRISLTSPHGFCIGATQRNPKALPL